MLVAQGYPTLRNSMDCSLPDSFACGVLQARTLVRLAISFSLGSSQSNDQTRVSCIAGWLFSIWAITAHLCSRNVVTGCCINWESSDLHREKLGISRKCSDIIKYSHTNWNHKHFNGRSSVKNCSENHEAEFCSQLLNPNLEIQSDVSLLLWEKGLLIYLQLQVCLSFSTKIMLGADCLSVKVVRGTSNFFVCICSLFFLPLC